MAGHPIPDEITLTREEAARILFALDEAAVDAADSARPARFEAAAAILIDTLMPDLRDL